MQSLDYFITARKETASSINVASSEIAVNLMDFKEVKRNSVNVT